MRNKMILFHRDPDCPSVFWACSLYFHPTLGSVWRVTIALHLLASPGGQGLTWPGLLSVSTLHTLHGVWWVLGKMLLHNEWMSAGTQAKCLPTLPG